MPLTENGSAMLTTFALTLTGLVLFYLAVSVKVVRQGYQYTIERFGRFTEVARPGLNFYPAFFYAVGRKINLYRPRAAGPRYAVRQRAARRHCLFKCGL